MNEPGQKLTEPCKKRQTRIRLKEAAGIMGMSVLRLPGQRAHICPPVFMSRALDRFVSGEHSLVLSSRRDDTSRYITTRPGCVVKWPDVLAQPISSLLCLFAHLSFCVDCEFLFGKRMKLVLEWTDARLRT